MSFSFNCVSCRIFAYKTTVVICLLVYLSDCHLAASTLTLCRLGCCSKRLQALRWVSTERRRWQHYHLNTRNLVILYWFHDMDWVGYHCIGQQIHAYRPNFISIHSPTNDVDSGHSAPFGWQKTRKNQTRRLKVSIIYQYIYVCISAEQYTRLTLLEKHR